MRVLHVCSSLDPVSGGGTAERTYQLVRALTEAGIVCSVVTLDVPLRSDRLDTVGQGRIVALPVLSKRFYLPRGGLRRAYAAVRDTDVVHLIGHWTVLNALAYLAAKWLDKPYVVCPAGALPPFGRSLRLKLAYNRIIGDRLVRGASWHVAITDAERRDFEPYGVDPDSVQVIPNGVRTDDADDADPASGSSPEGPLAGTAPFILFVGRLNLIKGPDMLLDAYAQARAAVAGRHLVFVGNDEGLRAGLERSAQDHGLNDLVHLVGPLHGSAKRNAYALADLLVVPSRREAMSIVALEAGAAGTPVLLTDACGFDDVEAVGAGRVVPASPQGLESGLRDLFSAPALLSEMGQAMRRLVEEKYTWRQAAERYIEIYGRAPGEPGGLRRSRRTRSHAMQAVRSSSG